MKKVLYDLIAIQPSQEAKFHGGGQYGKDIIMKACEKGYRNIDCIYDSSRYIDNDLLQLLDTSGIQLFDVKGNPSLLKELVESSTYKMFYSALPILEYSTFDFGNTIFGFTIHGLRGLEMPNDLYSYKYQKRFVEKLKSGIKYWFLPDRNFKLIYRFHEALFTLENTKVFTVSEHSKYSISYFYPKMKKDIQVYYSPFYFKEQSMDEKKIREKDYYLIVSSNRWIKNSYRAIKAFDRLFDKGFLDGKKVILLGADEQLKGFFKNKDRFILKGYVSNEELNAYMKNAFALVYPTLNEGFGYPPVQAMYYGVPAIVSAIASVSEICKDAVLYFNPYSIDEIANRILQINSDLNIRNKLVEEGNMRFLELDNLQKQHELNLLKDIFE